LNSFAPYEGRAIYLAFEKFSPDLAKELALRSQTKIIFEKDRLFLVEGVIRPALWAQSHWLHPENHAIKSIGAATKILKQAAPRWALHSVDCHRRCQLIQENLKTVKSLSYDFEQELILQNHGVWTLENPHSLWFSTEVHPKLPLGEARFKEDKLNPPSRAYLKLWELFTIHGIAPQAGQKVLDMGSCPGGWTWVLQKKGCQVVSVDKAPLADSVANLPRITALRKDAFSLKPEEVGPVDWFFSDIICYPEKLLELVEKWRDSGLCPRFVCTIKFQGATDFATLAKFAAIPNSRLVHLYVNKHEVTWIHGVST
jgi:23S rRNA (cytidine2498-2'-O)-methyltransferase